MSRGGFSGFGHGLDGVVVQAGRITALDATTLTLTAPGGGIHALRLGPTPRLLRLESATRASLRIGATVSVRLSDDSETVEAVLILSEP